MKSVLKTANNQGNKRFGHLTWQALILLMSWGMPWDESVPSFSRITGVGWKDTRVKNEGKVGVG